MKKCSTAKIIILPKGPYELCGSIPINQKKLIDDGHGGTEKREQGKDYPHEEITHLCRCGYSEKKPFCDGHHAKIGFEGTEYATKELYEQGAMMYQGGSVDLVDKEILCAAARFCHPEKGAWKSVRDSANSEDKERAIYQCTHCPSGRLTAVDKEGNALEPTLSPEIWLIEDTKNNYKGPLFVQGNIEVESSNGESYPVRNRQTLCRCGASNNMPFCDASHLRCEHMKGLDT